MLMEPNRLLAWSKEAGSALLRPSLHQSQHVIKNLFNQRNLRWELASSCWNFSSFRLFRGRGASSWWWVISINQS